MTTKADLLSALKTAFEHCKPGGIALFAPDHTKENFKPGTKHGGHDLGNRSMRYLEWIWDPDPSDSCYISLMVYVLREGGEGIRCVQDKHILGLFTHNEWLRLMSEAGFKGKSIPLVHSEIEPGSCEVFLGLKPY